MGEKKKICFYYPDMYVGGVEMAIINLAKRLCNDYEIFFLYRRMHSMEIAAELRKYGIPLNVSSWTEDYRFHCDVMIYCSLWLEQDNCLRQIKTRKNVLWSHAMVPPAGGTKFFNLPFMRIIDEVVSVSKAANETIPKYMYCGRRIPNFNVINNILNTEDIKEKSTKDLDLNLKFGKDLNICSVSRIAREKGWNRVRMLCDTLNKMEIDFKWFIVGEGYIEEEVAHAHTLLDPIPQVEFLGKQMNPFPIMKQMDYLALLSDFESWGLVLTESKIVGTPCIVTDFPAAKEQIEDGKNGIILPMKTLTNYKEYGKIILDNKEKYRENLVNFNFEEVNQRSLEKWKNILG